MPKSTQLSKVEQQLADTKRKVIAAADRHIQNKTSDLSVINDPYGVLDSINNAKVPPRKGDESKTDASVEPNSHKKSGPSQREDLESKAGASAKPNNQFAYQPLSDSEEKRFSERTRAKRKKRQKVCQENSEAEQAEIANIQKIYKAFGGSSRAWNKLAKSSNVGAIKDAIEKKAKAHRKDGQFYKASALTHKLIDEHKSEEVFADVQALKTLYRGCGGGFWAWHQIKKHGSNVKETIVSRAASKGCNENSASVKANEIFNLDLG